MIKYLNSFRKLLLLTLGFIFFSNTSFSQTYWDVDYNGQPVKKAIEVGYQESGDLTDSLFFEYYNDGKIKGVGWKYKVSQEDTVLWFSGGYRFFYKADTLYSRVSIDRGEEVGFDKVVQNKDKIFPLILHSYDTEKDALKGEDPTGKTYQSYNKKNQLVTRKFDGEYQSGTETYTYKNGNLVATESTFRDWNGNENNNQSQFEIIETNKYGWSEKRIIPGNGKRVRIVEEYIKEELDDASFGPQKLEVATTSKVLTIPEIMKKFYGNAYTYSPSDPLEERQARWLLTGINLFENDREAIDSTIYAPNFFYDKLFDYYLENDMRDEAFAIADREIEYFDGDIERLKELYAKFSYIYEGDGDYSKALEYYQKINDYVFSTYGPLGANYDLRLLRLMFLSNNLEDANAKLTEYTTPIDEQINKPDFDISKVVFRAVLMLDNLSNILEIAGQFDKADQYATLVKDYYGQDELYGKESKEYQRAIEKLIRIKKAKASK